jgi:phosphomannomutase/phosphoglucomutase
LLGGDVRLSTPALKTALSEGLVKAGCEVTDTGILTTPAFYYAVQQTGSALGVMVTASHNPPEYNGFKILVENRPINREELAQIQHIMEQRNYRTGTGKYHQDESWLNRYRAKILRRFQPGNSKIVLDCGNGSCSLIAPEIFRALGYQVNELFCTPDGSFPNRLPNPAIAKNLTVLAQKMKETGAAVGIAYDGDGDRVAFVDDQGQMIENDRILALFSRHLLTREKGVIVYDSKCSLIVAEETARLGGIPRLARSGHGFVRQEFIERNALLAGELSGHFFWQDLLFDDGIFSSLVLLELLQEYNTSLAQMDQDLPRYRITPDIRLPFAGDCQELIEDMAQELSGFPLSRLDGVRVELPDCWGLIRPSITEPILTLRFEGKNQERLSYIIDLILAVLSDELKVQAQGILARYNYE